MAEVRSAGCGGVSSRHAELASDGLSGVRVVGQQAVVPAAGVYCIMLKQCCSRHVVPGEIDRVLELTPNKAAEHLAGLPEGQWFERKAVRWGRRS